MKKICTFPLKTLPQSKKSVPLHQPCPNRKNPYLCTDESQRKHEEGLTGFDSG